MRTRSSYSAIHGSLFQFVERTYDYCCKCDCVYYCRGVDKKTGNETNRDAKLSGMGNGFC